MNHDETAKHVIDSLSAGTVVATFVGWLPHIAALLSVVWMLIRIIETDTVRKLINRLREPKQ